MAVFIADYKSKLRVNRWTDDHALESLSFFLTSRAQWAFDAAVKSRILVVKSARHGQYSNRFLLLLPNTYGKMTVFPYVINVAYYK